MYCFQVISLAILSIMKHMKYFRKSERYSKFVKKLSQGLFYGGLIAILIESYFEHLVAGFMQISYSYTFEDEVFEKGFLPRGARNF